MELIERDRLAIDSIIPDVKGMHEEITFL